MGGQLSWCYYPNRKPTSHHSGDRGPPHWDDHESVYSQHGLGDRAPSMSDAIPSLPIRKRRARRTSRHAPTNVFNPSIDENILQKYATPRERAGSITPLTTARSAGFTTPRLHKDRRRYSDRKERITDKSSIPKVEDAGDMEDRLRRIKDNRLSLDEILSRTDDIHAMIHTARARISC